jgi:hypothetical protein
MTTRVAGCDTKCAELAARLLHEAGGSSEERVQQLAQHIQEAVDDWFADEELRLDREHATRQRAIAEELWRGAQ